MITGGRLPPITDHVYGLTPPVALIVLLYATPFVASVSGAMVMIVGGATATVRDNILVVVAGVPWPSVTLIVKLYVPEAVGMPARYPVVPFRVTPDGKVPESRLQLYGPTPPMTSQLLLKRVPTVAPASGDTVMMESVPTETVMRNSLVTVTGIPWLSVTEIVKV